MPDLTTQYLGLSLKNPLVVSSSSMTKQLKNIQKIAKAGAGAVVLKSLFEEQIDWETEQAEREYSPFIHPEAADYARAMNKILGPEEYLTLIEDSKKTVDIPIIASLNCITGKWWHEYAKQIESAGADALEVNISLFPQKPTLNCIDVEKRLIQIVESVRRKIELPLAVKIGPYFTNLHHLAHELYKYGASALVLFNRFYQVDININSLDLVAGNPYSSRDELHLPLRWISILYNQIDSELSATTGIHTGEDAIKMLLAGATTVQICSTVFQNGFEVISGILKDIYDWMNKKQFAKIKDFRGILSQAESKNPEAYERLQYIKALTGIS